MLNMIAIFKFITLSESVLNKKMGYYLRRSFVGDNRQCSLAVRSLRNLLVWILGLNETLTRAGAKEVCGLEASLVGSLA